MTHAETELDPGVRLLLDLLKPARNGVALIVDGEDDATENALAARMARVIHLDPAAPPEPGVTPTAGALRRAISRVKDPAGLVGRMAERLPPRSTLAVLDWTAMPDDESLRTFDEIMTGLDPRHLRTLAIVDLMDLLEAHGFEVVESRERSAEFDLQELMERRDTAVAVRHQLISAFDGLTPLLAAQLRPKKAPGQITFTLTESCLSAIRR